MTLKEFISNFKGANTIQVCTPLNGIILEIKKPNTYIEFSCGLDNVFGDAEVEHFEFTSVDPYNIGVCVYLKDKIVHADLEDNSGYRCECE